jgi:hypothetical protein
MGNIPSIESGQKYDIEQSIQKRYTSIGGTFDFVQTST